VHLLTKEEVVVHEAVRQQNHEAKGSGLLLTLEHFFSFQPITSLSTANSANYRPINF
jgi:hypothetical protein